MKTQYGFRGNRSTVDALFIARRIQEYAEQADQTGLMLLLDWEKALDKVDHEWLIRALKAFNIPVEIMRIIEGLYKNP